MTGRRMTARTASWPSLQETRRDSGRRLPADIDHRMVFDGRQLAAAAAAAEMQHGPVHAAHQLLCRGGRTAGLHVLPELHRLLAGRLDVLRREKSARVAE